MFIRNKVHDYTNTEDVTNIFKNKLINNSRQDVSVTRMFTINHY